MAGEDDIRKGLRSLRPQAEIGLADPLGGGEMPGGPSLAGLLARAVGLKQLELPLPVPPPRFDPRTVVSNFDRLPGEIGYVYHATNVPNAAEIAQSGRVNTFPPDYGTEQSMWPDRGIENRSYWTQGGGGASIFAPEGGPPVLLRTKQTPQFRRESGTGDFFTREPVQGPEYFSSEGWRRLGSNR
jgi:hypothetical protein